MDFCRPVKTDQRGQESNLRSWLQESRALTTSVEDITFYLQITFYKIMIYTM